MFKAKYHHKLAGTNILETKEGRNNDDDDNDIEFLDEAIEVPNDNEYHEPRPQNPIPAIGHPSRPRITRVSRFQIVERRQKLKHLAFWNTYT
jgi:hypothetical protein